MRIHPQGYKTIFLTAIALALINLAVSFIKIDWFVETILVLSIVAYMLIILFFRKPNRRIVFDRNAVLSPCDGKIVNIGEAEEYEYFKDKRIQVSIFMSPLDVHINWYSVSGIVAYVKHHKGKFMAAWKPKSSLLNERNTLVIKTFDNKEILMRQIAGAMARRIVSYPKTGDKVLQCMEYGFIKFGSRVDLFLPLNSKILVRMNQKVKGAQTRIAGL